MPEPGVVSDRGDAHRAPRGWSLGLPCLFVAGKGPRKGSFVAGRRPLGVGTVRVCVGRLRCAGGGRYGDSGECGGGDLRWVGCWRWWAGLCRC